MSNPTVWTMVITENSASAVWAVMASFSDALLEARDLMGKDPKLSITPQGKILVSEEDNPREILIEEWHVGEWEMPEDLEP